MNVTMPLNARKRARRDAAISLATTGKEMCKSRVLLIFRHIQEIRRKL